MQKYGIKNWRETDRPREKILSQGSNALSDAELIAIILHTGTRTLNVIDMASQLLAEAGNLRSLLQNPNQYLSTTKGIGPAKTARMMAAVEIGRRYLGQFPTRGMQMSGPDVVKKLLISKLRDREHESFVVLFLDNRHKLLQYAEMFHGTIDSASVHPREIIKQSMLHNAAALIVAHNHPSGVSTPSSADKRLTQRLKSALSLMEIRLLDHLIVGESGVFSFSESGML
ncbi:MAG: RadC family protein [Gammaproteobacteria bacterium]